MLAVVLVRMVMAVMCHSAVVLVCRALAVACLLSVAAVTRQQVVPWPWGPLALPMVVVVVLWLCPVAMRRLDLRAACLFVVAQAVVGSLALFRCSLEVHSAGLLALLRSARDAVAVDLARR